MNQLQRQWAQFGLIQVLIVILTLATAIIHLNMSTDLGNDLHFWFLLNGIGYIVLLIALYLPQTTAYHRPIRWVLIGYTALTIVLWTIIAQPYDSGDFPTKIIESLLIASLLIEDRQMHRHQI